MIKFSFKKISPDKKIEYFKEELRKKDEIIKKLREENELLLRASVRSARRRIEELKGPESD